MGEEEKINVSDTTLKSIDNPKEIKIPTKGPMEVIQRRYNQLFMISIIITVLLTMLSLYLSWENKEEIKENNKMINKHFLLSNKPNIFLTEVCNKEEEFIITMWNAGPGTAYDISCETHFAETIGNVGSEWAKEVVKTALSFQTKDRDLLLRSQWDELYLYGGKNPHPILSPGFTLGYSVKRKYSVLDSLFLIIRYKDSQSNSYYSLWDGYHWKFGNGDIHEIPKYKEHNQVVLLFDRILNQDARALKDQSPDAGLLSRLLEEATFLESKGDKNIKKEMQIRRERYEKKMNAMPKK